MSAKAINILSAALKAYKKVSFNLLTYKVFHKCCKKLLIATEKHAETAWNGIETQSKADGALLNYGPA